MGFSLLYSFFFTVFVRPFAGLFARVQLVGPQILFTEQVNSDRILKQTRIAIRIHFVVIEVFGLKWRLSGAQKTIRTAERLLQLEASFWNDIKFSKLLKFPSARASFSFGVCYFIEGIICLLVKKTSVLTTILRFLNRHYKINSRNIFILLLREQYFNSRPMT